MKDRNVEFPNRYRMVKVEGTDDIFDLIPAPGEISDEGTFINKFTLLKDATAEMFGLGADAVPDDVFSWFGYYTKHLWNKRTHTTEAGYVEVKTKATRNDGYYITQGNSRTIYVATSISINQSNGEISLKNPVTLTSKGPGYFDNYRTAADLTAFLRGKYVLGLYGASYGDHPILYLDDTVIVDSVGDFTDGISFYLNYMGGSPYVVSSQYFNNAYIGDWEVLSADTSDAYPKSGIVDGYEYRYVGVPFENMKFPYTQIETGSYAGTGTYGASNPSSLTFGFVPKVVFISTYYSDRQHFFFAMNKNSYAQYIESYKSGSVDGGISAITSFTNVLSWYSEQHAMGQMNASGATYNYIAIG